MPGIFGVVDLEPLRGGSVSERLDLVRRMALVMCYEPAYVADIVSCPSLGACAGRVGWACDDSTSRSTARAWKSALLTAGEPVIDALLSTADHRAHCGLGSGARELARHVQEHGIEVLRDVEGAFSGFLIDPPAGKCVLFNDRYGAERLFVRRQKTRVFFASEAKAILAVAESAAVLDPVGLAEWLACGCTLGAHSLFQGIEVLPGGTAVTFSAPGESRKRYFDRSELERLPQLPARQFVEEFTQGLASSVSASVGRSPRAALSLTGGLDSRLVIGLLEAAPGTVATYTFGSMYRLTMDAAVAREVAANCEQPHQVLTLGQGFLDDVDGHFQQAVRASDGYLGLAGSAELYLNRLARQVAPVRVTGNWGGELMRGVRAFKVRVPKGDFIRARLRDGMGEAARTFSQTSDWHPLSYTLFQQMPYQGFGRYAVERSQVQMRSPFLANTVVKALYQSSADARSSMEVVSHVLARRPGLASIPTDTGRLGHSSRPVAAIRQGYRRAMVKAEYMTSHGAPDWMAALSARIPFLERAFLGRDKFQHFRLWMRHGLSGFAREAVRGDDAARLADWFDMGRVKVMLEDHIAGRANYVEELDKVMTLAVLLRNVGSGAPAPILTDAHSPREIALEMSAVS